MITKTKIGNRNESLDYLRGLAALGVMAYHLSLFSFGESDASTIIARVKIFAVSIFYVLSGLTLFIANHKKLYPDKKSVIDFYLKRFFRIFPLLWLAILFTYLLKSDPEMYTLKHLIVNITILPGMIRSDAFVANGAWSIGNELFFYVFFPFLFFLFQKNKKYFVLVITAIFAAFCLFTFKLMDPKINLGYQWFRYVNPFNQFFYFAIGICIAAFPKTKNAISKFAPLFIFLCLLVIAFYPANGEPVVLVTGITRIIISVVVICMCYLFYICDWKFLPAFIKKSLQFLGDTSYSIYILHPLIYIIVSKVASKYFSPNPYVIIAITVILSLILSNIVYKRFELYFMKLGKKVIENRNIGLVKNNL